MAVRYFLAEMEGYNPATSAVETFYFTDGPGLATKSGDSPANEYYESRLMVPSGTTYERSLFADGHTGGASQITISDDIALNNADGALDGIAEYGWDGRAFRLYAIDKGAARSTAVLVLTGVMEQLLPQISLGAGRSESKLVIRLKDPLSRFDVPVQPTKYLGTNVGPAGLEGLEDDIKGLPKPIAYGKSYEATCRLANASELVYQVADGVIAAIDAVYDNGVALALDADYATPTLLLAATPASGEYATCKAYGLLMLGASPAGQITADVANTATPLPGGDAVDLDGTDDYFQIADALGTLETAGPTRKGVFSCWFRIDGGDGTSRQIMALARSTAHDGLGVALVSTNKILVLVTTGTYTLNVQSTTTYTAGATWRHLLAAWDFDLATPCKIYVDAVDVTGTPGITGSAGDLTLGYGFQRIGQSAEFGYATWHGGLAELWYAHGQWVDITVAANVERWRTSAGYPMDLGSNGQRPTGLSPLLYFRGGPSSGRGDPDGFALNLGTAGPWEQAGAPALASSTPYAPVPASPGTVTASEIIREIVAARVGLLADEIDDTAFDDAILDAPEDVGIWIGDERSVRDALDEIAASAALAYWFDADGLFRIGRFSVPAGSAVATLTFDDIIEIERQPIMDTGFGLPAYSVKAEYRKIYTVQPGNGLAGSVSAERRAYLEREYREISVADNTVRAKHINAPELPFRTLITNAADAATFAADRLRLHSTARYRWRVRVALDATTAAFDLFDLITLEFPRYDHDGGRLYRVIGISTDFRGGVIDLDLWGGSSVDVRITEAGDVRITEAGERRLLETT